MLPSDEWVTSGGTYRADDKGYYWYVPLPEEIHMESYRRHYSGDGWLGDWNVHISKAERDLTDDEYDAIVSVLSGETKEEWAARRAAEGKPISPIGEGKQD